MKTVHLLRKYNPSEWGGTETAIHRLLGGLRHHGVQSVVYHPRLSVPAKSDPLRDAGHSLREYTAFVPVIGMSGQRKRQLIAVGGNLMSFDLIRSLWREDGISIMHTHTLGRIGGIALTVARRRQIPLVISIHGGVFDLPPRLKHEIAKPMIEGWEWGKLFGLLFQSHRLFRDADAIITCNQNEAALLRERYPQKRIVVQQHGVPLKVYQQDHREAARSTFPTIRGHQVILCVGRIDPIKNQSWLISQVPSILQRLPGVVLVLAGACTDEGYGARVEQQITELGLKDRVLRTGGLPPNDPRLIGLFQAAEVVVVPSISETFCLVALEAWACGTLVVSSRTSGASALLRDGQNGWLFDLDEPRTFHRAVDAALSTSGRFSEIAHEGFEQVSREFSLEVVAGRMKQLYEELLEERHALCDHS